MDCIAIQIGELEQIVRNMLREIESYRHRDDFFQRMATLRFAANDAICKLYAYARTNADWFGDEDHRFRFCQDVEQVKENLASHQSRWSCAAIKKDYEAYVAASNQAAKRLLDWIEEMRKELKSDHLFVQPLNSMVSLGPDWKLG